MSKRIDRLVRNFEYITGILFSILSFDETLHVLSWLKFNLTTY